MERLRRVGAIFMGVVLAAHGIALALMQHPMIATSNKRGAMLYFKAVESLAGERAAWVTSGALWFAMGIAFVYLGLQFSGASPKGKRGKKSRRAARPRT